MFARCTLFALSVALLLWPPNAIEAQSTACDGCADAPWGKYCLHEAGDEGVGCHQHDPDHCDYTGPCESQITLNDLSVGGSLERTTYVLAGLASYRTEWLPEDGAVRRLCDGAVTHRFVSDAVLEEQLEAVERIVL